MDRLSLSLSVGDVHLVTLLPQMEGLVVPSKFYGIAAAARPCVYVGDPNGEIGQLISRNRLGFTFSPGDDKGLLEALLDLQRNVEKRTAMGMRARTLFDTEFNKPLAIGKWETVLLGVADAQGV